MRQSLRSGRLWRRILWVASPLLLLVPLLFGVHSMFGVAFVNAAPLLLEVPHFQFEQQAQQHCPDDSVVWATPRSGVYNSSGERWYGQTSDGTFACLLDAQKAGYHVTSRAR